MHKGMIDEYISSGGLICPNCKAGYPAWDSEAAEKQPGSGIYNQIRCTCQSCGQKWTEHLTPAKHIEVTLDP